MMRSGQGRLRASFKRDLALDSSRGFVVRLSYFPVSLLVKVDPCWFADPVRGVE